MISSDLCTTTLRYVRVFRAVSRVAISMGAKYSEDDVAEAIFDITDRGLSVRKAVVYRGIPRAILYNRMKGIETKKDQFQPFQRLSQTQEDRIS